MRILRMIIALKKNEYVTSPKRKKEWNQPYIKQAIHFLSLNSTQKLNLQKSTYAKNWFRKLECLQDIFLFVRKSLVSKCKLIGRSNRCFNIQKNAK